MIDSHTNDAPLTADGTLLLPQSHETMRKNSGLPAG
jgi:hypothetical protein